MILFHCVFFFLHFLQVRSGYIERVTVSGCESCRLLLTCRHLNSVIAILEANFEADLSEKNITDITPTAFPPILPRDVLNKRCSGVNHCSFILTEDCAGTENWGPGNIIIKYACITEDRIKKYCNSEIVLPGPYGDGISEGFIHNPGYPRFYPGLPECRWKITAPSSQKIQLSILDLSLIVDNVLYPEDCKDVLEILDNDQVIYSTCRQDHPPQVLVSTAETLEVVLKSTHNLNPQRGVLIHFTALGCILPRPPRDGYLVYRNETSAEYLCCVGYEFPDTGSRRRVINCLGAYWDVRLPLLNCERTSYPTTKRTEIKLKPGEIDMASELITPVVVILALFLINGFVLFYIYKVKQKQAIETNDEELGSFTATPTQQITP